MTRRDERRQELALALGASDEGELLQRDTYYSRARGRLKLREQEPGEDDERSRVHEQGLRGESARGGVKSS